MIDPRDQELAEKTLEAIKVFNDADFTFNEKWHQFKYKGQKMESSTQYNKRFQVPFDSDYWSKKIALRDGKTQAQVLADWKKKAEDGRDSGSAIHKYIEDMHTQDTAPLNPVVREDIQERVDLSIQQFHSWAQEFLRGFYPVAFELKVFDAENMIAGIIDSIWVWKGMLFFLDWKGNKQIKTDDDYSFDMLKEPFQMMAQNDVNVYSMQQSFYQYIFEKRTGLSIKKTYIVNITPEACKAYGCKNLTSYYHELFR